MYLQFLTGYPNGLWGDLFIKFYMKKYGKAPDNILQVMKDTMTDRIEINW